jgi:hypothetical protein
MDPAVLLSHGYGKFSGAEQGSGLVEENQIFPSTKHNILCLFLYHTIRRIEFTKMAEKH